MTCQYGGVFNRIVFTILCLIHMATILLLAKTQHFLNARWCQTIVLFAFDHQAPLWYWGENVKKNMKQKITSNKHRWKLLKMQPIWMDENGTLIVCGSHFSFLIVHFVYRLCCSSKAPIFSSHETDETRSSRVSGTERKTVRISQTLLCTLGVDGILIPSNFIYTFYIFFQGLSCFNDTPTKILHLNFSASYSCWKGYPV